MPEDIRTSLVRMQYEEPTHFSDLYHNSVLQDQALVTHLRSLDIPCGNGPPLPKCTWIPVFSTTENINPELTTATLTYALATPSDVRNTVSDAAKPGMTVDAVYAEHEGKQHLFLILCDQLMGDDWNANADIITRTPGRLGRAVEQGAALHRVPVRHWRLAGGHELWETAIAEEQEWIRQCLHQDPGDSKDFRSGLENATA